MTGYNTIVKIEQLTNKCAELGFRISHSKHSYDKVFGDVLALYPKDDALPAYNRDAELFVGTLESLEYFLYGVEWTRKYDTMMLGSKHLTRIEKAEQSLRNKQLMQTIKDS